MTPNDPEKRPPRGHRPPIYPDEPSGVFSVRVRESSVKSLRRQLERVRKALEEMAGEGAAHDGFSGWQESQ